MGFFGQPPGTRPPRAPREDGMQPGRGPGPDHGGAATTPSEPPRSPSASCRNPRLHVPGIDILDHAPGLARHVITAGDVADRVTVRKRTWPASPTTPGFDLAWLPAPFISQPAVARALPRVAAALHPGGWLVLGHSKSGGTPVEDALTRLKTVAYGGTPLDEAAACHPLHKTGLTSVPTMPTPSGAPASLSARNRHDEHRRPG